MALCASPLPAVLKIDCQLIYRQSAKSFRSETGKDNFLIKPVPDNIDFINNFY